MYSAEVDSEPEQEPEVENWVRIQQNTFTNWVNDKLRIHDLEVENIRKDFKDGVKLCKLMEALKGKRIGKIIQKKNLNHYEAGGNMQIAFNAMAEDGVRLVNIGSEDVTSGNIKLILGMLWILIRRYQIGSQSKLPPKGLMLSWCNAVLYPHLTVKNFSSDWNDGVALHGLVNYCQSGACPEWYHISRGDRVTNCANAMQLALELFDVPMVMRPEDLASPDVDELSGMTYLSYFMAVDSPGYKATLDWVKIQIGPTPVDNFDRDWNNGYVLSALVKSLGGTVPGWPNIDSDWQQANFNAIQTAKSQLSIEPVLKAKDLINPEVDHIGVMAHAAWHEASLRSRSDEVIHVREPTPPLLPQPTIIEITAPSSGPNVDVVINDQCQVDVCMTIEVETSRIGPGSMSGYALAPSGGESVLNFLQINSNVYHVELTPTETGSWLVHILYNGDDVIGSPYSVNVFDPSSARISRDYGVASQHETYTFEVDVQQVGVDDLSIYVVHEGVSVPHQVTPAGFGKYHVSFTPKEKGSYTVAAYCGGADIPGSPFDVVCKMVEGIEARGPGLMDGVTMNETQFEVDTSISPGKDLLVTIAGPSGQEVEPKITPLSHGQLHSISFTPIEPGVHSVTILYDGVQIHGSPFRTDIRKCKVYVHDFSPYAFVGQKSQFKIDASEMRKGRLEIDSDIPVASYDKVAQNIYMVTIIPRTIGLHDMVIKYNNQQVEGCPFEIDVKPSIRK